MALGLFDLDGTNFLALYVGLLALAIAAGVAIPRWLRPHVGSARTTDVDQLALLAGGVPRLADSAVARLLAAKALAIDGRHGFRVLDGAIGRTPVEQAILQLASPMTVPQILRATGRIAPQIRQTLVQSHLIIDRAAALRIRLLQTTPYLLLLVVGLTRRSIGVMRDRPVGDLTALLILTAILALIRFATLERRTRAGVAALETAREAASRLRRAPLTAETGLAVALFGTVVLSGSEWGAYHRLRAAVGDGGVTITADGGDDGGSGCGGGGCGGCGS